MEDELLDCFERGKRGQFLDRQGRSETLTRLGVEQTWGSMFLAICGTREGSEGEGVEVGARV